MVLGVKGMIRKNKHQTKKELILTHTDGDSDWCTWDRIANKLVNWSIRNDITSVLKRDAVWFLVWFPSLVLIQMHHHIVQSTIICVLHIIIYLYRKEAHQQRANEKK